MFFFFLQGKISVPKEPSVGWAICLGLKYPHAFFNTSTVSSAFPRSVTTFQVAVGNFQANYNQQVLHQQVIF